MSDALVAGELVKISSFGTFKRPHRLVFIIETSISADMIRLRGRSTIGTAVRMTPFGRWTTQTFIAGLTCDALIASRVIESAIDRAAIDIYVETQWLWRSCRAPS